MLHPAIPAGHPLLAIEQDEPDVDHVEQGVGELGLSDGHARVSFPQAVRSMNSSSRICRAAIDGMSISMAM